MRSGILWVTASGLEVHEAPRLAPTAERRSRRMRWSRSSRVSIFRAGAASAWRTMCYLGPDGPERLSDGRTELVELA